MGIQLTGPSGGGLPLGQLRLSIFVAVGRVERASGLFLARMTSIAKFGWGLRVSQAVLPARGSEFDG